MRSITRITALGAALTLLTGGGAGVAEAAPALRVQVNQHGDFLLIGNTLGYECANGTPAPVVGTLAADACQQTTANISDSSPDVYWSADTPANGQCTADTSFTAAQARSTAVLTVPSGATVTHAFLYWSAVNTSGVAGATVTLDRVGAGGFGPVTVNAGQSWVPGLDNAYQSFADVTPLVQQYGSGAYRVSGIDVAPFANVNVSVLYGGWWLVAFYQLPSDPVRNLALFDGLDVVKAGSNQSITLSGFLVPNAGFDGKLGVVAFEGDNTANGDALLFNGATLSNAQNPADNFFNSTRSWLGAPVSVAGDLPQLTGTAQSMAGVDIDVVDISAYLTAGQSSAPVQATTAAPVGDTYYLGGFITSISTYAPDFTTSTKSATDVSGQSFLDGDTITYTITAINTGNDTSVQTIVTDPLPSQVTYVPGSITIDGVSKTDASGDDQAEYTTSSRTVTARLGMGANATMGGSLAMGASSVVTFQVKVNDTVTGDISNQGTISAGGQKGAPTTTFVTDGNGSATGNPPTVITVGNPTMGSSSGSTSSSSGTASSSGSTSSSGGTSSTSSSGATSSSSGMTSSGAGGAGAGGAGAGGGGFIAVGNGVACAASAAPREGSTREGGAWILGAAVAGLVARRRRRAQA